MKNPKLFSNLFVLAIAPLFLLAGRPAFSGNSPNVSWQTLTERTTCEAMNPDYCVGNYGFSVNRDGTFVVGPGPAGEVFNGRLSPSDLSQISRDADLVASNRLLSLCTTGPRLPGSSDQVKVVLQNNVSFSSFNWSGGQGQVCFGGGQANATKLHADLNALMREYYTVPFPAPVVMPVPPSSGMPGQAPSQMPGQAPGQMPGQAPGQMPGQAPGQMPGQAPGQMPGQAPGQMPGQQP